MAAKRRGIVVYHGTLTETPPHTWFSDSNEGVFHAGTRKSAIDRLIELEALQPGDEYLDVQQPHIYKYEITPSAPMSMLTHADTVDYDSSLLSVATGDATKRIRKYKNKVEDPGSTSYTIPVNFVKSGMVKHLGEQFYGYNPDVEDPSSDAELVPGDSDWWQYKRQKGKN